MRRPTLVFGELLHDLDSSSGRLTSYFMYLLNIVFLSLYIVGTYDFAASYSSQILFAEFLLALVFLFEYVSRIDYAEDTWAAVKDPYSVADMVAVIPVFLAVFAPFLVELAFFRAVQILRVFRFVRIGLEDDRFFNYDLSPNQVIVAELLMLIFLILTIHAGVIHGLESGVNPDFQNFGDAMYYSVVALTTTGFGNVAPVTSLGKFATSLGLIAAVTLIPWLVVRAREKDRYGIECSRCGMSRHLPGSNYCRKCGEKLE